MQNQKFNNFSNNEKSSLQIKCLRLNLRTRLSEDILKKL